MTDQEIQASRDYLYGYYCRTVSLTIDAPSDSWLMGFDDAGYIVSFGNTWNIEPVVAGSANWWAKRDLTGVMVGVIKPRKGLALYFGVEDETDPIAEGFFVWSAPRHAWVTV